MIRNNKKIHSLVENMSKTKCTIYHLFIFPTRLSLKTNVFFTPEVFLASAFKIDFQSKTKKVGMLDCVVTTTITSYQY